MKLRVIIVGFGHYAKELCNHLLNNKNIEIIAISRKDTEFEDIRVIKGVAKRIIPLGPYIDKGALRVVYTPHISDEYKTEVFQSILKSSDSYDTELYIDGHFCIDLTGDYFRPSFSEYGSFLLGEKKAKNLGKILYPKDFNFKFPTHLESYKFSLYSLSDQSILLLEEVFHKTKDFQINLIINEKFNPNQLPGYISDYMQSYEIKEENTYLSQLKEWDKLENYEKVKIPKPQKKDNPIKIFDQSNILSFDFMEEDNFENIYITLDRKGKIETIKTPYIFASHYQKHYFSHLLNNMDSHHLGFLTIDPQLKFNENLKNILSILERNL